MAAAQLKSETYSHGKLTTPTLNSNDDEIVFLGGVTLSNKSLLALVEDTVKMCCQLITKLTGKSIPIEKYLPSAVNKDPFESMQLYFVSEGDCHGPDFRFDGSYLFVTSEKESIVLPLQYKKDSIKKIREVLSGGQKPTNGGQIDETISSTTGDPADQNVEEIYESNSDSESNEGNSKDEAESSDSEISDGPGAMQDDPDEDPDFEPYATNPKDGVAPESSDSMSLEGADSESDPEFLPSKSGRGRRRGGARGGGSLRGGKRKVEANHNKGSAKRSKVSSGSKTNVQRRRTSATNDSEKSEDSATEVSENDFQVEKRVKKKSLQQAPVEPKVPVVKSVEKPVKKQVNFWDAEFDIFAPQSDSSCESAYNDEDFDADVVKDSDASVEKLDVSFDLDDEVDELGASSLLMEVEEDPRTKLFIDENQQEDLRIGFPLDVLMLENVPGFRNKIDSLERTNMAKLKFYTSLHCSECKRKNLPRLKKVEFDVKWPYVESHLALHKETKLYFCFYAPHCQLVFFSETDRDKHALEHQCDCCCLIKRDVDKLAIHKKIHNIGSLKDGYECGECQPDPDQDIVSHLSDVHFKDRRFKGRVFACGFMNCRLLFLWPEKYLEHFNDVHRCSVCYRVFKNKNIMMKHKAICKLYIHGIEKGMYKRSSFMAGQDGTSEMATSDIDRNECLKLAQEVRFKQVVTEVPVAVEGEDESLKLKGMRFVLLQSKFGLDAGELCTLVVVEKKNPEAKSPVLQKLFGEAAEKLLAYSEKKLEIPDSVVDDLGHTILCTPSGFDFLYKEGSLAFPEDSEPEETSTSGVVIKVDPDTPEAKKAQQVQIQYKCLSTGCYYFSDSHRDFITHVNETHSRTSTQVLPRHQCQACGKAFATSAELLQHIKVHVDDPNTISEKVIYTLKDRAAERRRPGKDKLHICLECGRCFIRKSDLLKHIRYHSTLKWRCMTCSRRMASHRQLALHNAKFHSDKLALFCEVCYMQFPSFCSLMDHRQTVHIGFTTD